MSQKIVIFVLALGLAQIPAAHAESIKDALNHDYKKQVLALRSPFAHGNMKFDSAGQPLHAPPKGPWLLYGGIYVENINISRDTLRLEGHRVAVTNEKKKDQTVLITLGKSVKVEIHLDQPLLSRDDARALLDRIFYLDATDGSKHATPELVRSGDSVAPGPIYHVNQDEVKPPKAIYTPDPEFTEEARRAKFQGVVVLSIIVDRTGQIVRVRLVRALGRGLDENAMQQVKDWRFSPATRNGEPVAVEMNIEVSFNLY